MSVNNQLYTLFHALTIQHNKELTPIKCNEPTIKRITEFFEEVLIENNLSSLLIKTLNISGDQWLYDPKRVSELSQTARFSFFFVPSKNQLAELSYKKEDSQPPQFLVLPEESSLEEIFLVVSYYRFSALLAAIPTQAKTGDPIKVYELFWTFEPNIVYTALQYLQGRIAAEFPKVFNEFQEAVNESSPKDTSVHLAGLVTTKLVKLLQEQFNRDVALGKISRYIRDSILIEEVLENTIAIIEESLRANYCAISIRNLGLGSTRFFNIQGKGDFDELSSQIKDELKQCDAYFSENMQKRFHIYSDGRIVGIPLIHRLRLYGVLIVRAEEAKSRWDDDEILFLVTIGDQIAASLNQNQLVEHLQTPAFRDPLTGCFTQSYFDVQLEKEVCQAARDNHPLTLMLIDIDHLKELNDRYGFDKGDEVLKILGTILLEEVRGGDTAARYGDAKFALILHLLSNDNVLAVAERIRKAVEIYPFPVVGKVTVSIGISTYQERSESLHQLLKATEQALANAKMEGRNRVCIL
jgi:diguanylate cyclase (GGDEF)-like protein